MSNSKDSGNNKPIKDFLNSRKNSSESAMDDFDKEAMEGFDSIQNEEEIINLKAKLDTRIYNEVFSERKKTPKFYWYAAAGLFVVIGFSVYFVLNTTISKKEALAIESKSTQKDEIQKNLEKQTQSEVVNETLEFEDTVRADNTRTFKQQEQKRLYKNIAKETAEPAKEDLNFSDKKELASTGKDVSINENAAPEKTTVKALPIASTPAIISSKSADIENSTAISRDEDQEESQVVSVEAKKQKSRSKEAPQKTNENTIAAGASSASADFSAANDCYYAGGETVLQKELKLLLKDKNLLQKFNATLYITENGSVDKVTFSNSFDLSKDQQVELVKILKGLDKFKCTNLSSGKPLGEYRLDFTP